MLSSGASAVLVIPWIGIRCNIRFRSQTQVISRKREHHLFNDGVYEDWLEPPEHWGRIVRRRWQRIIAGNIFVRTVSTAQPQEGAHGHAGGIGDAACIVGPCSFVDTTSGLDATAWRESRAPHPGTTPTFAWSQQRQAQRGATSDVQRQARTA